MPYPGWKPPGEVPSLFLESLKKPSGDAQLSEINSKLDTLIDMLNPPKSAIITGPEVERVIQQIEKARGRG